MAHVGFVAFENQGLRNCPSVFLSKPRAWLWTKELTAAGPKVTRDSAEPSPGAARDTKRTGGRYFGLSRFRFSQMETFKTINPLWKHKLLAPCCISIRLIRREKCWVQYGNVYIRDGIRSSKSTSAGHVVRKALLELRIHDLQLNLARYIRAGYAFYHSASGKTVNKYFFQHHLSCGILLILILLLGRTQKCRNVKLEGRVLSQVQNTKSGVQHTVPWLWETKPRNQLKKMKAMG